MKKSLSVLSLLFGLFVCVTVFSACGGDDEPSSGGNNGSSNNNQTPSNPQSTKHIVKIITERGKTFIESTLFYDSQGRVRKIIKTKTTGTGENSYSETEYQYDEMLIVSDENKDGETHSYTLENGLIVKDEEKGSNSSRTRTFSYDTNKYLSSISNTDSDTKTITWSDGNLTKTGDRIYSYTNYSWTKGFPLYLEGVGVDEFLFANGYFGNIPKNLPETYHSLSSVEFVYTLEGNYVTKIVLYYSGKTQTMTYIWE